MRSIEWWYGVLVWYIWHHYLIFGILPYLSWAIIWMNVWLIGTIVLILLLNSNFKIWVFHFPFLIILYFELNLMGVQAFKFMLVLRSTVVVWFICILLFTAFYLLHFVTHNPFSNSNLVSNVLLCFVVFVRLMINACAHIFYISVCFQ